MDFESLLKKRERQLAPSPACMVTDPRHIAVTPQTGGFDSAETPDAAASPNGNSVSLEEEMIKVSDTQAQYQAADQSLRQGDAA